MVRRDEEGERVTRSLTIAGQTISDDSDAWVIAEIGSNHQGSVQTCKEMIRQAKLAGCDSVKLQKRDNRSLYTPEQYARPYDSENSFGRTYGEHREALEFNLAQYRELKDYAESIGIVFFATAFDKPSVDFLMQVGVPAFKIASFDVRNTALITYAASMGLPMIVSTGSATEADVLDAWKAMGSNGALLHCTSQYPCPPESLNLAAITQMRETYPFTVIGFSSHFAGISMPLVAYTLGARIIEAHFTLNRAMKGSDHAWSLEPDGMRRLVRDLRRARLALGDGVKRPIEGERAALERAGKVFPSIPA